MSSVLITVVYAMLLFPHVQKTAQQELDRVIGSDNLPVFEDEHLLPYVTATLLECMRWNPAVPFGVPHLLEEEDTYHGYRLPKNSMLIGNACAMLHDEVLHNLLCRRVAEGQIVRKHLKIQKFLIRNDS